MPSRCCICSNIISQATVVVLRGSNIRISCQNLHRIVQSLNQASERVTSLGNRFWLTKRVNNTLVSVDAHVQVGLQSVLRLADQEKSNLLGNGITHVPQDQGEVMVDTFTQISHDGVTALLYWGSRRWAQRWVLAWRNASWWAAWIL